MTDLKFHAQIAGSVSIGHDLVDPTKPGMTIPLTMDIPVDPNNPMTFTYKAADEKDPFVIPVGEFIEWAVDNLKIDLSIEHLPEAVRKFSVAVFEMTFRGDGTFTIILEMGEQSSDNQWSPVPWQPIEQVPVSFSAVKMVLERK